MVRGHVHACYGQHTCTRHLLPPVPAALEQLHSAKKLPANFIYIKLILWSTWERVMSGRQRLQGCLSSAPLVFLCFINNALWDFLGKSVIVKSIHSRYFILFHFRVCDQPWWLTKIRYEQWQIGLDHRIYRT